VLLKTLSGAQKGEADRKEGASGERDYGGT